jgi:hypothetical protein
LWVRACPSCHKILKYSSRRSMMLSAKNNCKCKKCSKIKQLYQTLGGPDHHIGCPEDVRERVESPEGVNDRIQATISSSLHTLSMEISSSI